MADYLHLPIGSRAPEVVNAVIEIPLGASNKYEYDKTLQVFCLDRALFSPVHFPGDYGFIPSTLSADGDPLDILVLVDQPSFSGCLIEVRPVGMMEMVDQESKDQKVLAVGTHNPRYAEVRNYSDVYEHVLKEISHFFAIYKELEGKQVQPLGWRDVEAARQVITEAHERFRHEKKAA